MLSRWADLDSVLCDDFGLGIVGLVQGRKGVGVFTALGLLLIYGMGFWVETMQTLALVLSSTIIALMIGVPLGIWTARSDRADKIIHPVLDLMQTMPAFVYLIPAVLFLVWDRYPALSQR